MQNDLRSQLCIRLATATASLYRLAYANLVDGRQGSVEMIPQLRTVMLLADRGPLRVSEIADCLGSTRAAMTYTLSRLVERKLVERVSCPQDRRVIICDLAPDGRKLLEEINYAIRNRVLVSTDMWSLERLESVVEALESIPLSEE